MAYILLVDDQPYMGEFLAEELADMGHSLKCVSDGDSLMFEIEEDSPDLVLLDLYINGFEGWNLLDRIKRHDSRIPVIILTAYDSFSGDPRLDRAQGYVIKDFATDKLRSKIAEVLRPSDCAGLPGNKSLSQLRNSEAEMAAHKRGKIRVVLLAEDDEDDVLLIRDAFAESGISIELHSVLDGEELLEYLFRRNKYEDSLLSPEPSLILLDLNMPRKDGREALAEIKTHPVLRQIPVVVLTTSRESLDIQQCYKMGASSYVAKPNSFNDLVDVLKTVGKYWLETVELPPSYPIVRMESRMCD
jgi:two-component system, response regulator